MAGAGYSLPPGDMGYVELTAWFLYGNTPFDEGGFAPDYGLAGNTTAVSSPGDLFLGQVGFRGVFASSNTAPAPYFTLGMGFYHVSVPEIYVSGAQNFTVPEYAESAFGWSAGLGVDIPLSEKLVLFADGKFILGVTGEGGTKQGSVLAGVRVDI
jgi:hypothetical protein